MSPDPLTQLPVIAERLNQQAREQSAFKLEVNDSLGRIERHVSKTNGTVAALVEDKIRRDERERLLAEQAKALAVTAETQARQVDRQGVALDRRRTFNLLSWQTAWIGLGSLVAVPAAVSYLAHIFS